MRIGSQIALHFNHIQLTMSERLHEIFFYSIEQMRLTANYIGFPNGDVGIVPFRSVRLVFVRGLRFLASSWKSQKYLRYKFNILPKRLVWWVA